MLNLSIEQFNFLISIGSNPVISLAPVHKLLGDSGLRVFIQNKIIEIEEFINVAIENNKHIIKENPQYLIIYVETEEYINTLSISLYSYPYRNREMSIQLVEAFLRELYLLELNKWQAEILNKHKRYLDFTFKAK